MKVENAGNDKRGCLVDTAEECSSTFEIDWSSNMTRIFGFSTPHRFILIQSKEG